MTTDARNPHAVALGRLGGLANKGQSGSPAKAAAARRNGRLGGRPRRADSAGDAQPPAGHARPSRVAPLPDRD
jgi:hypothetical protein